MCVHRFLGFVHSVCQRFIAPTTRDTLGDFVVSSRQLSLVVVVGRHGFNDLRTCVDGCAKNGRPRDLTVTRDTATGATTIQDEWLPPAREKALRR
jgi:hypothetical protein